RPVPEAMLSWQHPRWQPMRGLTVAALFIRPVRSGLRGVPVDALDVVIHARRQDLTPTGAARGQHLTAAFGLHAGAEAMYAGAAANLRLVGTFRHCLISQKNKGISPDILPVILKGHASAAGANKSACTGKATVDYSEAREDGQIRTTLCSTMAHSSSYDPT